MAIRQNPAMQDSAKKGEQPKIRRGGIPLFQYMKFRRAKTQLKTELLNESIMNDELRKEAKIVNRLRREHELFPGNGLEMFVHACKRRLGNPRWHRILQHSANVRKFAYYITHAWFKQHVSEGMSEKDRTMLSVISEISGYHDIGKTLIAPYLVNREEGTAFGIGRGERIDLWKELPILRESHIEAGLHLLELYRDFMGSEQLAIATWIIGGHHIAYDGVGSASAPSYPKMVNGEKVHEYIARKGGLPLAARIMRAADVYSAIMENRFYLNESERIVTKVTNIKAEDVALGMLITVAGTDVDPSMVKALLMGKYKLTKDMADLIVGDLSCREKAHLREKGGDIDHSLKTVIPHELFSQNVLTRRRSTEWDILSEAVRSARSLA